MPHFCILTDSRFADPADPDPLVRQAIGEDLLLAGALEERNCAVERLAWDSETRWTRFDALVFRSTWDYMDRIGEFRNWLDRVEGRTTLLNRPELIRWNLDKHYLDDLQQKGIAIPPTLFISKGEKAQLTDLVRSFPWQEVILKPVVSAGARHTHRFPASASPDFERTFRQLIAAEDMMIQEFQSGVLTQGELSLVMIGGEFSHAVRKKARAGDFRVQDDFGGSVERITPGKDELEFAGSVLEACGCRPPYARVDILRSNGGQPLLSELELIEPELWFRLRNEAASALADYLIRELKQEN